MFLNTRKNPLLFCSIFSIKQFQITINHIQLDQIASLYVILLYLITLLKKSSI